MKTTTSQILFDLHKITKRARLAKSQPVLLYLGRPEPFRKARPTGTTEIHRPRPTAETRLASADELRARLDAILERAHSMFQTKEITGNQLAQFEATINRAKGELPA